MRQRAQLPTVVLCSALALVFAGCAPEIREDATARDARTTSGPDRPASDRATEAFGLYALSGKATAFLAPFLIAVATDLSGSQRIGISPLIVMFLLALGLLSWVNPEGEPEP